MFDYPVVLQAQPESGFVVTLPRGACAKLGVYQAMTE